LERTYLIARFNKWQCPACQTRPSDAVSDLSPAEGRGRTKERYLDPYLSLDFASGKSRGGQWRRVGELGKASEVLGDCPEYELILDSSGAAQSEAVEP
jgi:hypothetical protein